MDAALYSALRELGTTMSSTMVKTTCGLLQARLRGDLASEVKVFADQRYGDQPRQWLDVYCSPGTATERRPVLIFVHGGGFVAGERSMMPNSPFYANIAQWAAQRGLVGVNMTYRLAPDHPWPSGADDVARAVQWVVDHIEQFGGDARKVYLMGQSAGSVHVADYVARNESAQHAETHLAGAMLISCLYDVGSAERNKLQTAYFGSDFALWTQRSALTGLLTTRVPLLCAVAEFDIPDFQAQATQFAQAWWIKHQTFAPLIRLSGHNHLSTILQLGSDDDTLGPELVLFIEKTRRS